jgi:calcineurin-like phosphoesterase family protein
MKIWFISDTHFGHDKILEYTKRPFKTIEEMNTILIKNWNTVVKPEDLVIHLGDFNFEKSKTESPSGSTFQDIKKQLHGELILIKGSHDNNNGCKAFINSMVIFYGGQHIFLTHNPKNANTRYNINLTGHEHGRYGKIYKKENSLILDLSVDLWNYTPVSIGMILDVIKKFERTQ